MKFWQPAFLLLAATAHAQSDVHGWYAEGQVWLIWTHDQAFTAGDTYEIYASDEAFTELGDAQRIGRVFPEDGQAGRLKLLDSAAKWKAPNGAGGSVDMAVDEMLFVDTPRAAGTRWYAVVPFGATEFSASQSTGAIDVGLEPIRCHPVYSGVDAGHPFTVYGLWIDGDDDPQAGRGDFPVMGNASMRGTGHLFALVEPSAGLPAGKLPAVLALHGGTGNFSNFMPSTESFLRMNFDVDDGLYISVDDGMFVYKEFFGNGQVAHENTRWFGYWRQFDRFDGGRSFPPIQAVVYDYSLRRLDFVLDWLTTERNVDSTRISMMGVSMGGAGLLFYARSRPARIAAGHALVHPVFGGGNPFLPFMQGSFDQNLATSLGVGLSDYYWPTTTLSSAELPFLRLTCGINDTRLGWAGRVTLFEQVEALRWGAHLYWDEREHGPSGGGWIGVHWATSPRLDPAALTRHRTDRSFPAFSYADHDAAAGRQPDPGDEGEFSNGDPWGTWGGYLDWEDASLIDQTKLWEATLFVVSSSPFANDVPTNDSAVVDVTVRRAQRFRPAPGALVTWRQRHTLDGSLIQAGRVRVGADGLVTVPALVLEKQPSRLELRTRAPWPEEGR